MTGNQLLLYRLAELMLEKQENFLLVDDLFDDEQIGDFVKSIQIDSPYQQLLFEGVLTESVNDERLYISFTVEGYFHYVLGEVIYNQSDGRDASQLKRIVEVNKLKGAKNGVEQCLIRDVQSENLTRLMWLIDIGGVTLDLCCMPLASAFLNIHVKNDTYNEIEKLFLARIEFMFSILFVNYNENAFIVLDKTLRILQLNQHHILLSTIYKKINELIIPDTIHKAKLYVDSIEFIPSVEKKIKLNFVESFSYDNQRIETYKIYNGIADQYKYISEYEKADNFYEKSIEIGKQLFSEKSEEISGLYNDLSQLWREAANYEKALILIEKSIVIDKELHGENNPSLWAAYGIQASIYWLQGDFESAIKIYEWAIVFAKAKFGKTHPNVANLYNNYGNLFADAALGDYDKAIIYFESALSISLKIYSEDHDLSASLYNNLGLVYRDKNDYEKALSYFQKALSIYIKLYGDFNDSTALLLANLGYVYWVKDELEKALDLCERSFQICKIIHRSSHPTLGNVLNTLGMIWKDKGNSIKAIEFFQQSIENDIDLYGDSHYNVGVSFFNLADFYKDIKMIDDALNYYALANKNFINTLGIDHEYTLLSQERISDINSR